jgi:signal transduction histidine kinase
MMGGVVEESSPNTKPEGFLQAKFQADSALLRELGERLVGQPHIALAELIKNAYDADATECAIELRPDEIVVTDNGHGMTEAEFLEYWMTIGTRNKQLRGVSRNFGRPVTGSKGVGRLSAQFLAHELEMVSSSSREPGKQLHTLVNWDEAAEAGKLTEAEALYRSEDSAEAFAGGSSTGTRVTMRRLKQSWTPDQIRDLGREVWMIQSPLPQYGRLSTDSTDALAFAVNLSSWRPDISDAFQKQMKAALENYDAVISGKLARDGDKRRVQVTVKFRHGDTFSETFDVDPYISDASWTIRVFKLQGRQFEGVKVGEAREYFEKFGGVQVYDAAFRLPYYGVQQDWLGIEYDHSHRRNKSSLLPERLHVRRALNDLPTQGRLFGVVSIDTGREARAADEARKESGEYLKIQVTRDRLVANKAYEVLRDAVRWSLDYYATRERLREERVLNLVRPSEPGADKVDRIRAMAAQVRAHHPEDDDAVSLDVELADLSKTLEQEKKADDAARALLGPLASAGMAALAFEHESRKEFRLGRTLVQKMNAIANDLDDDRVRQLAQQIKEWIDRLESTRKVFSPLMDIDDRERVEALSGLGVLRSVVDNVRSLLPGLQIKFDIPRDLMLPPATFSEWNSLFQNVLINAANASLDVTDREVLCSGGHTGRSSWIEVSDKGAGIDWQQSDSLFEPFARASKISEERRMLGLGGMGLGLTIVRMVADLRRCKVRFIEPESGWSTTFQISWSSNQ